MIYSIFVDGKFVGITDNEYEIYEIANNCVNNSLNNDISDRLHYCTINVNQWTICQNAIKNATNEITGENIFCHNKQEAENAVKILNKMALKIEREEARKRAMTL